MGKLMKPFMAIHDVVESMRCKMRPLQLIKKEVGTCAMTHLRAEIWFEILGGEYTGSSAPLVLN